MKTLLDVTIIDATYIQEDSNKHFSTVGFQSPVTHRDTVAEHI